ncbi:MAG: Rpn family recombination-promoting nuclease/putative transposase [Treponema sp.]|jgi:predicted transposase/invertase (TIGR01784 family)|nr:Rpn family recombination-promoting nuclease/putative transposase [Treponema sp.]
MDFKRIARLNPLNDFAFQKAMGEEGDEAQLTAFLRAVLDRTGKGDVTSVRIIENTELKADAAGGKAVRLDVLAEAVVRTERVDADIEVQIKNEYNMARRSLYYWARKYGRILDVGEDYTKLPAVVAVNILGYGYFAVADYHTSFHLWEDRHKELQLTDACEIHFLDMVRFRKFRAAKGFNLDEPLNRWMAYFDKKSPRETIEEVLNMDATIQEFQEKLERIHRDKALMRMYDQYEKTERDWISSMRGAERKGELKGVAKGRIEGEQIGVAKGIPRGVAEAMALLERGLSADEIKARYGL